MPGSIGDNVRQWAERARQEVQRQAAESNDSPAYENRWGMDEQNATARVTVENLPIYDSVNRARAGETRIGQIPGGALTTERSGFDLVEDFVSGGNTGEVQQLLVNAGLISGQYQIGVMDDKTATAIGRAARFASQNGMGFYEYLFDVGSRVQGGGGGGRRGGGGGRGGPAFVAPNRDDVTDALRDLVRQTTGAGGNLSDEMAGQFYDRFVGQLQASVGGAEEPQGFEGAATDFIEEQLGAEFDATKMGAVLQGIGDYVSRPFVGA